MIMEEFIYHSDSEFIESRKVDFGDDHSNVDDTHAVVYNAHN